jgi:hypothetical protein
MVADLPQPQKHCQNGTEMFHLCSFLHVFIDFSHGMHAYSLIQSPFLVIQFCGSIS